MKNIFKIAALFLFLGAFTACVQDDDYTVPTVVETEPLDDNGNALQATTTFALVHAMYTGSIVDFDAVDSNLVIEGYVISNDRTGNFYKSIFIQDAPENPTYGLRIDVDMYDTYLKYGTGRKVYVKLNGLFMDKTNEVMAIGTASGTSLERMSELVVEDHVLRSTEVATLIPTLTTTAAIQSNNVPDGILIQLDNMQVPLMDLGSSYANPGDTYTQDRIFESCDNDETVIVRNSGFADFKAEEMPNDAGTLVAVLSQYNSTKQLYIRGVEDLDFTGERCDPLFADGFNSLNAWTVYSVLGTQTWGIDTYSEYYARISGYDNGTTYANEDWLISPAVDLTSATAPFLSFRNLKRYSGNDIEVFMSTDYSGSGDPYAAGVTWTPLSATLDTNTGSWSSWTNSGNIDLSAANGGNVYVAFKFSCTASGSATWGIDNVFIDEL